MTEQAGSLPGLVIGGAPKCGTSSLFDWLVSHPEVVGSTVKEPHFLVDRGHPLFDPSCNVHDHGLEAYGELFPAPDDRLRIEASTHYLYQETAPRVLGSLDPGPLVAFVLREPAARVHSSYRFSRGNRASLQPRISFQDFIDIPATASATDYATPGNEKSFSIWRQDVEYSRYVTWLEDWLAQMPRHRIRLWFFEDLRRDPLQFMRQFSKWVEIDPNFYETYDFPTRNRSYQVAAPSLHRWIMRAARWLPRWPGRDLLRDLYLSIHTSERDPVPEEDRRAIRTLTDSFAADNERLAELFDIDISPWK